MRKSNQLRIGKAVFKKRMKIFSIGKSTSTGGKTSIHRWVIP